MDKVVVVTGAGKGLGKALVQVFLEEGCKVVAISRGQDPFPDAADEAYLFLRADVADFAQLDRAMAEVVTKFSRVDILFNNAAVYPKINFIDETAEQWMETIAVNLGGVVNGCKAVLPYMVEQAYGRIYNLGSFADLRPIKNSSAYSVSKGGLHALGKSIAVDLEDMGVDVQVHEWIPGHLNTQMSGYTGIEPLVSAAWALDMVQRDDASSSSVIFDNDHEFVPPVGLKQRIKNKVIFWR